MDVTVTSDLLAGDGTHPPEGNEATLDTTDPQA